MIDLPKPEEIEARIASGEDIEAIKAELVEALKPVIDAITEFACDLASAINEALGPVMEALLPLLNDYLRACGGNPRWMHLSRFHKRKRIRKKWQKALWKEALKCTTSPYTHSQPES